MSTSEAARKLSMQQKSWAHNKKQKSQLWVMLTSLADELDAAQNGLKYWDRIRRENEVMRHTMAKLTAENTHLRRLVFQLNEVVPQRSEMIVSPECLDLLRQICNGDNERGIAREESGEG